MIRQHMYLHMLFFSSAFFFFIFVLAVSAWKLGFLEASGTVPSDFNRVRFSTSVYLVFHSVYSELHFSLLFFFFPCALCLLLSFFLPLPPSLLKHDVNQRTSQMNLQPVISEKLFHKLETQNSNPCI